MKKPIKHRMTPQIAWREVSSLIPVTWRMVGLSSTVPAKRFIHFVADGTISNRSKSIRLKYPFAFHKSTAQWTTSARWRIPSGRC